MRKQISLVHNYMRKQINLLIKWVINSVTQKILGPYVHALIVKTDKGLFSVDFRDYGVGRHLRMAGNWSKDEIERLIPRITSDSKVLIVGAHLGALVIPVAKLCEHVVAIEANPATYGFLVHNIGLNSISNCAPINIAASDKEENINFIVSRANSGGSKRTPRSKDYIYYYDNPEEISVKAVSLDQHLEAKDFDIVVMDIEGSEYFALKGMQEILSKCKMLVVEFLPHHLRNVSSVTVEQFLSVIAPHFSKLTIPSKNQTIDTPDFIAYLSRMYESEEGDDGIIFEKV
jgi:FkbM family methyltransferase